MAKLPIYTSLDEKNAFFRNSSSFKDNKIDSLEDFNNWYNDFSIKYNNIDEKFNFFFRGMCDAKHKLYTSSQRVWITNEMKQWNQKFSYLNFIQRFVNDAKQQPLLKKVFEFYGLEDHEADFPVLSILQHYGAPTPLMDWSYNLDVALYFATENVALPDSTTNEIDDYFSIYVINKSFQSGQLKNIFHHTSGQFPDILGFQEEENNPLSNFVFYISDFEDNPQQFFNPNSSAAPSIRKSQQKPITVYFNQNILPQEGLFIFTPYSEKPLEQCFNTDTNQQYDLYLTPFMCYNIKKDLADYIRRKIASHQINNSFT